MDTPRKADIFPLAMIAAVGDNFELGRDGDLCWHLPEDLRHFKEVTMGAAVIMGRKTWESLPRRPLPGRLNIVVSRSLASTPEEGVIFVTSLEEAIARAASQPSFIIGGASVYEQAMPLSSLLFLTRIMGADPHADTFFPAMNPDEWELSDSSDILTSSAGINYRFETYRRKV